MRTALRHPGFRWIAALYAADSLLEWFGSIALMVLVYRETESTTVAAAMLLCKQVAPGLLVPFFGAALERLSVGRALGAAFVVQAAALAATGALGYGAAVFPLAVVAGTSGAIVRALLRTGTARLLAGDDFRAGNAVLNIAMGIAALAGPALAALVVGAAGAGEALVLTGLLMGAGAAAATLMPGVPTGAGVPEGDEAAPAPAPRPHVSLVPLSWLLGLVGLVTCIFSMDDPALLAYSEESLGAGVGGYGAIFTAWGVGVTLGSLLFTRLLHWPMLRVYALATVLAGGAYLGMSVSPTITITCVIAVVGGLGNGMDWVAIVTAVQEAAQPGEEAMAATRLEAIATAGPGIGILLGGVLADVTSPRITLLIPGVLALAILGIGVMAVRVRLAHVGRSTGPGRTPLPASIPGGSA